MPSTSPQPPPESPPTRPKKFKRSERRVERTLCAQGWTALYHNVEILGVQVDLIMRDREGQLVLIEVKGQSRAGLAHLNRGQARRLFRVCLFLSQWEAVTLRVAFVRGRHVQLLPVE